MSGYAGGRIDNLIMRLADMQTSFPTTLVALLIDGLSRAQLPRSVHALLPRCVVILSIASSPGVIFYSTVRGRSQVQSDTNT